MRTKTKEIVAAIGCGLIAMSIPLLLIGIIANSADNSTILGLVSIAIGTTLLIAMLL